jgi:hypothetical protein
MKNYTKLEYVAEPFSVEFEDCLLKCDQVIHEHFYSLSHSEDPIVYSPSPQRFHCMSEAEFLLENDVPLATPIIGYEKRCYSYYRPSDLELLLAEPEIYEGEHEMWKLSDRYGHPVNLLRCVPRYHIEGAPVDEFVMYMQRLSVDVQFTTSISASAVELTMSVNDNDFIVSITANAGKSVPFRAHNYAVCIAIANCLME